MAPLFTLAALLASHAAAAAPLARDLEPDLPSATAPVPRGSDDANLKTYTSGLALSVGFGSQYPIVGAQAAYYFQLPRSRLRVAPYGSIGALCFEDDCTTGWMLGAMGSWGKKHRLVLDAFLGTVTVISLQMHGEPGVTQTITGSGLALGYEYMAFSGFFLRGSMGGAYAFGPPIHAPIHRIHWMLTPLGIGYKFW